MTWHASNAILDSYVEDSLDPARASSLEAHLLSCAECRERIASPSPAGRQEQVWARIQLEMDAPQPGPLEALLLRVGFSEHLARLLAATPSLSFSWLGALALMLAFTVVAAHQIPRGDWFFLLLAPLLPVAGVAAAFGPVVDPTYEIGLASPMSSLRILLIRTTAVLLATLTLVGLFGLGLPGFDWTAADWLLPGLALTLASLALSTWVSPLWAAGLVSFFWIGAVVLVERADGATQAASRASVQFAFVAAGIVAATILTTRRGTFELRSDR